MANKIDTLLGRLKTACDTLVTSGLLTACERAVINPLTDPRPAVLGLSLARFARDSRTGTWDGQVLLQLKTSSGATADGAIVELAARVDAAIDTLVVAGTAGGLIDQIVWDPWYVRTNDGRYVAVGCVGGLRFTVEPPLITA